MRSRIEFRFGFRSGGYTPNVCCASFRSCNAMGLGEIGWCLGLVGLAAVSEFSQFGFDEVSCLGSGGGFCSPEPLLNPSEGRFITAPLKPLSPSRVTDPHDLRKHVIVSHVQVGVVFSYAHPIFIEVRVFGVRHQHFLLRRVYSHVWRLGIKVSPAVGYSRSWRSNQRTNQPTRQNPTAIARMETTNHGIG